MNNKSSRNKARNLKYFQDEATVESSDRKIKFAKLTNRSINKRQISSLHQPLWFWEKHSQWSYFKRGLFWGGIIGFTAVFSAGCGVALTKIDVVQEAIAQRIEANSNPTESLNQAVLSRPIDLLLIEVEPDTNSMVKFSNTPTSIGKTKAIMVLQFNPHHRLAKAINIPTDSRVKIPGFGWGTIADAYRYGGVPLVSQVLSQLIDGVNLNHYLSATSEVFQQLAASGKLTLNNCDSRIAYCSNKAEQISRQEDTFKAIRQQLNIPAYLASFQATVTNIKPRLDTDLSLPELMSIANFVKDLDPENITTSLLPEYVPEKAVAADNRPSTSESLKAQSVFTTATSTTKSLPSSVLNFTIAVQNTTNSPELGMKVVNYLRQQNFKNVYLVEHIPLKLKQTQIIVNHSHLRTANYVKNVLDFGRLKPNSKSESQELTIKIGKDANNLSVNN